jgi:hypothetical protein
MGSKRMSAGRFSAINNANKAGMKLKLEALAAAKTLDAEDSGKIFALNLAGGFDVTLPNASDAGSGWYCRFVVKVAPTTAYTISATAGDGDNMHGCVMNSEGGAGDKTGGTGTDVLTFVANKAQIGDYVELFTDGTLWYVTAQVEQNDAFTLS